MSYPTHTKAIICYIEAHVMDNKINYDRLEKSIGFSKAHIRDIFQTNTGIPLVSYARMRKIKSSAADLLNTDSSILDIGLKYGFNNPETYTRAFTRVIGMTPSAFREKRPVVGKEELYTGVYGLGILEGKESKADMDTYSAHKDSDSTILYGVHRAAHGEYGGNTPYPICLKSCSEYLGEDIGYYYTMVTSAAAFRFVWNNEMWDLSNVDIFHTFNETNEIYQVGAKALGREFSILERNKNTTKEEFISFIKKHIDAGYPCIALGIVGPPEPCIITGYRNNGEELLGWNFFQNDPEFASSIDFDESGYFISSEWWKNTDTQAVMCMGPIIGKKASTKEILINAVKALEGRVEYGYSKGVMAYDAWKKALEQEQECNAEDNYSCLFEKMLCQMDAMSSLIDGRNCAVHFFRELAEQEKENRQIYLTIADYFKRCASAVKEMLALYEDGAGMDGMIKHFADHEVRKKTCRLILRAENADKKALMLLNECISGLSDNE